MMKYYIYTHSYNGIIFYVGSNCMAGNQERAYDLRGTKRTPFWNKYVSKIDRQKIEVKIIERFETSKEAKKEEIKLIQKLHDINQAECSNEDHRKERNGMYGKHLSLETKEKISKVRTGKRKFDKVIGVYQLNIITNEVINKFETTRHAAKETGISQGSVVISCNKGIIIKQEFLFCYIRDYK